MATKDAEGYPSPKPVKVSEEAANSGRFCRFHNRPGHDTNECRHLRNLVEELIRKNRLQEYVKRSADAEPTQGQQTRPTQDGRTPASDSRQIINTISGGPHPAGDTWEDMIRYTNEPRSVLKGDGFEVCNNSLRRKMPKTSCEDVIFRDRDSDGMLVPTVDPMVITIGLGPAIVKKVLIDNGASVNVLFYSTFSKMGLSMDNVRASKDKIHGFTGVPTQPIGVIDLLVELGEGERQVSMIQSFVIIDSPSGYNAFLGRPALADFRIALAPWCLMMKFPTANGVGVIKGDPQESRECYMAELIEARKYEIQKDAETPLCIHEAPL